MIWSFSDPTKPANIALSVFSVPFCLLWPQKEQTKSVYEVMGCIWMLNTTEIQIRNRYHQPCADNGLPYILEIRLAGPANEGMVIIINSSIYIFIKNLINLGLQTRGWSSSSTNFQIVLWMISVEGVWGSWLGGGEGCHDWQVFFAWILFLYLVTLYF